MGGKGEPKRANREPKGSFGGGLGPAWAAKEQKGQKNALDFDHFGVHFGPFWHHFGGTLRDAVVCCGALWCVALWCVFVVVLDGVWRSFRRARR